MVFYSDERERSVLSLSLKSGKPFQPRECSTTLWRGALFPLLLSRVGERSNPPGTSRCGSCSLLSPLRADVRPSDDVIASKGPNNFHNDGEFIVAVKQTDPEVTWFVQGWWGSPHCPTGVDPTPNNCYCHCLQSPRAVPHEGKIQLPVEFLTNTSVYCAGNNGLSMVQPDGVTVMQTQPAYRCTPGGPLFSQSNGTVG